MQFVKTERRIYPTPSGFVVPSPVAPTFYITNVAYREERELYGMRMVLYQMRINICLASGHADFPAGVRVGCAG